MRGTATVIAAGAACDRPDLTTETAGAARDRPALWTPQSWRLLAICAICSLLVQAGHMLFPLVTKEHFFQLLVSGSCYGP